MTRQRLVILSDGMEQFGDLFADIRSFSPFETDVVRLDELWKEAYFKSFASFPAAQVVIALSRQTNQNDGTRIAGRLRELYPTNLPGTIILCSDSDIFADVEVREGKTGVFLLGSEPFGEPARRILAVNFILYAAKTFQQNTLSSRLFDYISTSFEGIVDSELLKMKKKEIEILNEELERKNKTDMLTRLFNRSAIFDVLEKERNRTLRDIWRINRTLDKTAKISMTREFDHEPIGDFLDHYGVFSVLMIDVDLFKKVNDTHGHLVGDAVLKKLGELLMDPAIFREVDTTGRFGGEEFIAILPGTNANNALGPALRLCEALRQIRFDGKDKTTFQITLSIGISEYRSTDESKDDIIRRADMAMYWAKEHGRNQIAVYERLFT